MIEALGPEPLVAVEPFVGFVHRLGAQPARHDAAALFPGDQPRILEDVEVLHDRRQRHGERLGEIADTDGVAVAQARQQRPPRRIGEGGERAVERGGLIVNHVVKYREVRGCVKGAQVGGGGF